MQVSNRPCIAQQPISDKYFPTCHFFLASGFFLLRPQQNAQPSAARPTTPSTENMTRRQHPSAKAFSFMALSRPTKFPEAGMAPADESGLPETAALDETRKNLLPAC
jgi:hypothetical protein